MIVLDASVVTIALPSAQRALHISVANRQWALTAYTLAFGGLLLIGGRIADYFGRKRMFIISLLGFAGASALGGLAQNSAMLFGARGLQGAFAAVMAPASLSLLTVTFTEPRERARAFGVYGAIAGGGAAIGLVLGGLLTTYASWRWTLLINVPIAIIAALAAVPVVRESRAEGGKRGWDLPGATTVYPRPPLAGLRLHTCRDRRLGLPGNDLPARRGRCAAGRLRPDRAAVGNPPTAAACGPGPQPGGSFLASLLVGIALFGCFLFLTYYMQAVLGYSAVKTGIAFLPFSGGFILSATMASSLLPRLGPRVLMTIGLLMGAVGMFWFAQIPVHADYVGHVLGPQIVTSIGLGFAFVPFSSTALIGVAPHDAGVASALVNATQQVGGSMGTALLNTIAASATASYLLLHHGGPTVASQALVHGYSVGFTVSAAVLLAAAIAAGSLVKASRFDVTAEEPAMAVSGATT